MPITPKEMIRLLKKNGTGNSKTAALGFVIKI